MKTIKTVAIIGGGIGGLTVAHELAERGGFNITIYEKTNACGGKAKSTITKDGYPGEHSIRTISLTYYHFRDTLKRIPIDEKKSVINDVIAPPAGSRKYLMFKDHPVCILPTYFPYTFKGFKEYFNFVQEMAKIVPYSEIMNFTWKLFLSGAMSPERRLATLEKISWDEYIGVENKSKNYVYYLHRLPEFYVAAKGNANAKSMSMLVEKSLFIPLMHPIESQTSSHDEFDGPTSDILIDPWVKHLKKLGVTIKTSCEAKTIELNNDLVSAVNINDNGTDEKIVADIYVFAVPVEIMAEFLNKNPQVKAAAPSISQLDKLHTEESSGIQFFCEDEIAEKFPKGWVAFMDSPWSIVGIYQEDVHHRLKPPVKGILSFAWSNFDEPGVLYGKGARQCTAEELKNEILAQVSMHKSCEFIKDVKNHSWHIDPELEFSKDTGVMVKHHAPLFVQLPGSYQYQPEAVTEIKNLFLAADYVRTSYDLATMESANEAGRKAANGILKYVEHDAKPSFVKKHVATGLGAFQWVDQYICKLQNYFKRNE